MIRTLFLLIGPCIGICLASPAAARMTGQTISITGGISAI